MNGYGMAALLIFIGAVSIFGTLYDPAKELIQETYVQISTAGAVGYAVLIFIQAVTVIFAIPIIIPNLALSSMYPFLIAVSISTVGYTIGVAVVYALMSCCKWQPSEFFQRLYGLIKYQPIRYTLLLRFVIMPSAVKNYGLASCTISFWVYVGCALVHGIYVNSMQIGVGTQLWHLDSVTSVVLVALTMSLGLGSSILFSVLAHRALRRREESALLGPNDTRS